MIQARGTHSRTAYVEQRHKGWAFLVGHGKFPREKEWKCMEMAKGERAQEAKAQAAVQESHLREWGDIEGLLGKVCVSSVL